MCELDRLGPCLGDGGFVIHPQIAGLMVGRRIRRTMHHSRPGPQLGIAKFNVAPAALAAERAYSINGSASEDIRHWESRPRAVVDKSSAKSTAVCRMFPRRTWRSPPALPGWCWASGWIRSSPLSRGLLSSQWEGTLRVGYRPTVKAYEELSKDEQAAQGTSLGSDEAP